MSVRTVLKIHKKDFTLDSLYTDAVDVDNGFNTLSIFAMLSNIPQVNCIFLANMYKPLAECVYQENTIDK